MRSSQAVTVDSPLSTAHLPRPDPQRGVFETVLVVEGRPVELDAHLDRLAASARELFGDPAAARVRGPARALAEARSRELTRSSDEAPDGIVLARLRLNLAADRHGAVDLSAVTGEVNPDTLFPATGVGPRLAPVLVPGGLGRHKWADRRLLEEAEAALGALPLIVDSDGAVLETGRANVFTFRDGLLVTPPTDGRILPGITRGRVLELARELGIKQREQPVTLRELQIADAVFLAGSIRGVEPVRVAPSGGAVTDRIAAALRRRWLGGSDV